MNNMKADVENLLDSIIDNLISERILGTGGNQGCDIEKELVLLSKDIRARLGSDNKLFMRYEELSTENENSSLGHAYKQGFKDGIQLLRAILLEGKTISGIP